MSLVLGIDPDTTSTGIALADESRVWGVLVCKVPGQAKGRTIPVERRVAAMARKLALELPPFLSQCPMPMGMTVPTRIVVEGQDLYMGSHADPHAMLGVAQVAGAAAAIATMCSTEDLHIPKPSRWKGSVPKPVHQARILGRYNIPYENHRDYVTPDFGGIQVKPFGHDRITKSQWKHVVDAIGLAYWGATDKELQRA